VLGILGEQRRLVANLAGAETANREAVAIQVRLGRSGTPLGLNQLSRLATVVYLQGRYRESERLMREGLRGAQQLARLQGRFAGRRTGQRGLPAAWWRLGYALHRAGDLEGAEVAYRRARDGLAALRPASYTAGYASCGLGLLLAETGDGEAARAMLARPEVAAADPDHPWVRGFGDPGIPCPALAAWARDDLAGFERALAASKSALRPSTRADRDLLRAEMLLGRGRAAEALPLCAAAVLAREASSELQPWRRAEAHLLRGVTLCRVGRRAEGLPEVARHAAALRGRLPRHRYLRLAQDTPPR
jgi:tetratricopeptide (TPR) repeat protein